MDQIDEKILAELSRNGRASASDISKRVNLSIPAVAGRIRRLEGEVIESYTVKLSRSKTPYHLMAFISVQLDRTGDIEGFRSTVAEMPQVLECHHISGPYDYLIKVLVEDTDALEAFLSGSLKKMNGVVGSNTAIVLSSIKETVSRI